jgi:hypothetical protein
MKKNLHKKYNLVRKPLEDSHNGPIPGSSYSHKNMGNFIYYSLNSDPAEELLASI